MNREQIYEEETIREQARLDEKDRRESDDKAKTKAKEARDLKMKVIRNMITLSLISALVLQVYYMFSH